MKITSQQRFPTSAALLWYELRGSRMLFLGSMLLSALAALLELINPKLVSYTVDYALNGEQPPETGAAARFLQLTGGAENLRANLWIPALLIVSAALLGALVKYGQMTANSAGAERLTARMRNTLFSHTERLPMSWYAKQATGDILQRCTSDVETVKGFVSQQLTSFLRILLLVLISLCFMANISGRLTLIASVFIPFVVGYSIHMHARFGKIFSDAEVEESAVSSIVQENLTGIRVVRAFGREAYECDRFTVRNEAYTALWVRLMRLMASFWPMGDLISALQVMTVTVVGAVFCVQGDMTAGDYIAFVSYNAMLVWPIRELGRTVADLSRAGVAVGRMREILNAEPEELGSARCVFPETEEPLLSLSHVSYAYGDGGDALHDISLTIRAGEKIGIIGGTGSGKSTLTDILLRTCDIGKIRGEVRFRGKPAAEYPLADYRRQFARVLQEPFLFSGTIAQNIAAASEHPLTEGAIREAAADAALTPALEKFTAGLETFVGERGVTLSGGQKQRCAIAAALAKRADILILDDAFSALDAETDAAVRRTLTEKYSGATVLIIAHRIAAIAGCDRIYVLDGGEIADCGTHAELIARKGIYRDIYELQSES